MFLRYWPLLYPFTQALQQGSVLDPSESSITSSSPLPVSTACGEIIGYANENLLENWQFSAKSVYDCLVSVPFLDAVALRFVDYYNTTIQFQSDLAYLKDPPAGYQQGKIDVQAALSEIKQNISAGYYRNQYEFEATFQSLVYQMHDSHVTLDAGILSAFTFGSPYDIMSVSIDGRAPPEIYFAIDIVEYEPGNKLPSPITLINGHDAIEYLRQFARSNSPGSLEEHGDWNHLMYNPVQDILGTLNVFGWTSTFYPGDNLTFTHADGTINNTNWLAFYQNYELTGPLETGGDFYNYFVLGLLPAGFNETQYLDISNYTDSGGTADDTNATSWHDVSEAFPLHTDIHQPGLTFEGAGFLTGYFYPDLSTAVLSIPSFVVFADDVISFSDTVNDFIEGAKAAGITKILIDLQQNSGGDVLMAFNTFKQFFPNINPYAGSRRRTHSNGDILGGAITGYWDSLTPDDPDYYDYYYPTLAANEWVVTDRINANNGLNFTSWQEYSGPLRQHGDFFSLVEQYNLTSPVFDYAAFSGFIPAGYAPEQQSQTYETPFTADNVALLTDGYCGSTCSLFVEMMTHEAGVRTVAVGGLPVDGPMQATSGTRGASSYSSGILDSDFEFAGLINMTANVSLPQVRDPGMFVYNLGFNLRDQVRQDESTPLQFQYEAANCRIYYTLNNAYNMTRLWRDAAIAMWTDPSLCVAGSTGYAQTGNTTIAKEPPEYTGAQVPFQAITIASDSNFTHIGVAGIQDGPGNSQADTFTTSCSNCPTKMCIKKFDCGRGKTIEVCQPYCYNPSDSCANNQGTCRPVKTKALEDKTRKPSGSLKPSRAGIQFCYPNAGALQVCYGTAP